MKFDVLAGKLKSNLSKVGNHRTLKIIPLSWIGMPKTHGCSRVHMVNGPCLCWLIHYNTLPAQSITGIFNYNLFQPYFQSNLVHIIYIVGMIVSMDKSISCDKGWLFNSGEGEIGGKNM